MKKFQLRPTTNVELIKVILAKLESLGYQTGSPHYFTNPIYWIGDRKIGQWIILGYPIENKSDDIFRDRVKMPEDEYPIINLDEFFRLTPEDCQRVFVSLGKNPIDSACITKDTIFIPYGVTVDKVRAIELANKILEVMQ